MSNALVQRRLNDLLRTYRYRAQFDAARPTNAGVGTATPSAMDLAMSVMRATTPAPAALPKKPDSDSRPDWMKWLGRSSGGLVLARNFGDDLIDSGPVKAAIDILSRPAYGVGNTIAEGQARIAAGDPKPADPVKDLKAFWKGFKGDAKVLPSDSVGESIDNLGEKGPAGKVAEFAARLGTDIVFDPLSYVTLGGASAARKGAQEGVQQVAETTAKEMPALGAPKPMLAIEAGPRFAADATGTVADKINPVQFADEVTATALTDAVRGMPKLQFPGIQVDPLYRTVENVVTERVPKQITETVEVPVEAAAKTEVPKPKTGEKTPAQVSALAEKRAIKMAMLQAPDFKVKGKYPVSDLLRVASTNPSRQADIERLINEEVVRIFKDQSYQDLPEFAQLMGRSGERAPFGLTIEQASTLFREGKIPAVHKGVYDEAAEDFTKQFPLHDPEDLKNVSLKNSKGETVSLHQYLSDLGIRVEAVSQTGKSKTVVKGAKAEPKVSFDWIEGDSPLAPATKKVTRTKTVFTNVEKKTTSVARLTPAESVAWALKHTERGLSRAEINYLRAARTPESFAQRVKELSIREIAGDFKTLQDVIAAHKAGLIPDASWKQLLSIVGAKNASQLEAKAKRIFKIQGTSKPKPKTAKDPISGETFEVKIDPVTGRPESAEHNAFSGLGFDPNKLERTTAPEPTIWDQVDSVPEIIEKVASGDTSAVARPKPQVTDTLLKDVLSALDTATVKNLVDPQDLAKYPWITKVKQAKRTANTPGVGRARNLHGWNKYSQADVFREFVRQASAATRTTGLKGAELSRHLRLRQGLMYDRVMNAMNFAELALRAKGVKFVAGSDNDGILMSMMDVLNNLDPKFVQRFLFSVGKKSDNLLPTRFIDAAEVYVRTALNGSNDFTIARETVRSQLSSLNAAERLTGNGLDTFIKGIEENLPLILQRVNANYAEESIKIGESVKSMTDEVIDDIIRSFTDPTASAPLVFQKIIDRNEKMAAVGRRILAPSEALSVAKTIGDSELAAAGLKAGDLAEATHASAMSASKTPKQAAATGAKQQASRAEEALLTLGDTVDLSEIHDIRLQSGIFRANAPVKVKARALTEILGKAFVANYGHAALHPALHQYHNVNQTLARFHRNIMQQTFELAQRSYGPQAGDKLAEAFKALQEGGNTADPVLQEIMASMGQSISMLFQGGEKGNFASRNGFFAGHLNSIMDKYGVPRDYRFAEDVPLANQTESWRGWAEVRDPLDVLDRVHAAYQRATIETTIARDISAQWGKTAKAAGYVRVADSRGQSSLFRFLDTDLYYPKEIAEQLPYLDKFIDNSIFQSGGLLRMYDEVLHMWKAGVTIYRPGHHVRNLVGDVGLSFLAGVTKPSRYRDAARILSGRASQYTDWDALRALQNGKAAPGAKVGKTTTVTIGRKKVNVTDDEFWRAAFNQGLLPDYNVLEDTAFHEGQKMMRIGGVSIRKPLGGRGQKVAGGISQSRDHWVRIAHFLDAVEKHGKKAKSLDEAFSLAGKEVRKWHPDGSDLTAFERQFMRRVIPFYSWFRKAIPLVVEGFAIRPGRAMVMPKAMYAFAQTMGVDPDSLANPFPQDLLLPDWLTDNVLGPQFEFDGNLYGINPGDPVADVGSSFLGGSPAQELVGGMTPLARVPMELATGTNFGTGTRIQDKSEYTDAQIPFVSQAANIMNRSITGGFQPVQNVEKGYEDGFDNVALINFLTGLGIKNYTKPNYLKSGQLEFRDQLRRAN